MKIKRIPRLTLLVAAGVVVTSIGAARYPATLAYATQPHVLTADNFQQVALQGWGDRANSWAWSMAWLNNKLYVGANRNYDCVSQADLHLIPIIGPIIAPYPPKDPNILCPSEGPGTTPKIQDLPPTISGQIWAMDPTKGSPITQTNWTQVYSDPYTITMSIGSHKNVLAPRDMGYRGMSVYTETDGTPALYVSGVGVAAFGGPTVPPPALLRSTDGVTFKPVPADAGTTMGDLNSDHNIAGFLGTGSGCCMRGQAAMVDSNGVQHFLVIIGGIQGSGSVFESTDPSQGDNTFQQISPSSMQVYEIAPFNGHLYLGIQSNNGYEVVRTDCLTPDNGSQVGCNPNDFTTVVPAGGGLGKNGNGGVTSMHVYTDPNGVQHLYVGTNGARSSQAAELVRINTDDSWDLIVGNARTVNGVLKTPLSGFGQGFGWQYNYHMWRMGDYQGVLYVGTYNFATMLLDTPQGPSLESGMGFNLWASADGVTFQPVTQNGFGDIFSDGVRQIQPTPYGLFVGAANQWYGLRIYQGQISQQALNLSPQDVQVDAADAQGTGKVALSWNAPSNATTFHVYRTALKRIHFTKALPRDPTDADSLTSTKPAPRTVWVPGTFAEIGTSTQPYFVDQTAQRGKRYRYYVVAQDAQGNLSAQSNTAFSPALVPAPTFGAVKGYLSSLSSSGKLLSAQVDGYSQSLQAAQDKLQSGDAQGSHDQIDALRRQVAASATTGSSVSRLYNEELALMLNRLEKRLTLVKAHVLLAKHLS